MSSRLSIVAGVSSATVALLVLSSCSKTAKVEARAPGASEAPTVAVAKATTEDLSHGLVLTAEFKPFQEVEVMAKVAGYVKKIYVDAGDRVQEGQLLAILEIPEMANETAKAAAAVERSNAEVARAKDEINRAESGHQMSHITFSRLADVAAKRPGLVAQQEIDDAHSKDLMAEAQVAAAKSNLSVALQAVGMTKAELSKTKTMSEYTRVTAPFAGVITKRYADTGSMIQAGTASQTQAMPLVRLSQNALLRLILPVPESAVPRVRVGQQVEVRVPTLNRTFPGKVARFADRVQVSTRTMETEVDVPNPKLILIPGMYAEVDLTMDHRAAALAIPVSAVDPDTESQSGSKTGRVLVVTADNRIEPRKVALGMETANHVEIQSGLQAGDLVVIGNRASLQPGQHVKPKPVTMAAVKEGQ
jgi:RND family efflux transporter MFP subunit